MITKKRKQKALKSKDRSKSMSLIDEEASFVDDTLVASGAGNGDQSGGIEGSGEIYSQNE